ncbi:MAG: glycosyltransferase family 2 protein [Leadbetterella sp.]|nr:glycosyltransferase family 2 protein [Leadbetterella sp.]
MIEIAVLITVFNRKKATLECLKNLHGQNDLNKKFSISIFLVDDGSTDGTSIEVKSNFPDVNIIQGNGKLFWNGGMRLAWDNASKHDFDAYLWLNNDTLLYSNCISTIIDTSANHNYTSIICGSTESLKNKGLWTYGGGNYIKNKFIPNYPEGIEKSCSIINGNCVFVPKYVYKIVGNLDEIFIHSIGDNDYSLRAAKLGIDVLTTGTFIGQCERNDSLPLWCLKETSLSNRFKNLYSPLANSHPKYYFIYEFRHFGLIHAAKHFLSIHLRALLPYLWK